MSNDALASSLLSLLASASTLNVFLVRDEITHNVREYVVTLIRTDGKAVTMTRERLKDALEACLMVQTKLCPRCNRDLPVELFDLRPDGSRSWCKVCMRKHVKDWKRRGGSLPPPDLDHPL